MNMIVYTLREVLKFKGKMLTRVVSLALGLIAGLLLFTYNAFELSYDRFQPDGDQIYQIGACWNVNGRESTSSYSYAPLADAMKNDIPEVEAGTCVRYAGIEDYSWEKEVCPARTLYADLSFFSFFSYPLLSGNPSEELGVKENIFISEQLAVKLFGSTEVVGNEVRSDGKKWLIAGVFRNMPRNTHLPFDVVKSLKSLDCYMGWNGNDGFYSYIRVIKGTDPLLVQERSKLLLEKYMNKDEYVSLSLVLQPLHQLYSHYSGDEIMKKVLLLGLLAVIVLVVSGLNYVLLSIASLSSKARLVGIHKVNGATSGDIFRMFMWETGVLIGLALVIAVGILWAAHTVIERQMDVSLTELLSMQNIWIISIVVLVLFLLAGILPARLFASVTVMQITRRIIGQKKKWKHFMLGFQFAIAVFLIAFLFVLNGQYRLLLTKNPGFEVNNLFFVEMPGSGGIAEALKVKGGLERLSFVKGVGLADNLPDDQPSGMRVSMDEAGNDFFISRWMEVDEDFFKVMEIPVIAGSGKWETNNGVIVNQEFIRKLNLAVGQEFISENGTTRLSGICRDFQIGGFYNVQFPALLTPLSAANQGSLYVLFRIEPADAANLAQVRKCIASTVSGQQPEIWAYTDYLKMMYSGIYWMQHVVLLMVAFVLIITLLGLVGYTADEVDRRTKEIAIRKVNGAKGIEILWTLGYDSGRVALYALPAGLLGAYWLSRIRLEEFVVKIPLSWWLFAGCGLMVLGIIVLVVVVCSYRAANSNLIDTLKSE